jgi:hypothetical protein
MNPPWDRDGRGDDDEDASVKHEGDGEADAGDDVDADFERYDDAGYPESLYGDASEEWWDDGSGDRWRHLRAIDFDEPVEVDVAFERLARHVRGDDREDWDVQVPSHLAGQAGVREKASKEERLDRRGCPSARRPTTRGKP